MYEIYKNQVDQSKIDLNSTLTNKHKQAYLFMIRHSIQSC
jgi:hypothetical protein